MNVQDSVILHDVDLMPFQGSMPQFAAGFFKDGRCIKQSLLTRHFPDRVWVNRIPRYVRPQKRIKGEFVFGGHLFPHYGHFLFESLARITALRALGGLPAIFFAKNDYFAPWQNDILGILQCDSRLIIPHEPLTFECVVFAQPQCVLHEYISDLQIEALARYDCVAGPSGENIWLSRGRHPGGGLVNEPEIEATLERRGWRIFHPQEHSVAAQIETIAGARNVAGLDGSAFYTTLLARRVTSNLIVISRRGFIPTLIKRTFAHRRFNHHLFVPEIVHVAERGANALFRAVNPREILEAIAAAAV